MRFIHFEHNCFPISFSHTAHAALTLWALGADPAILKASYEENSSYQRPAFESPGPITSATWKDHLGDEKYANFIPEYHISHALILNKATIKRTCDSLRPN